MQFTTTDSGLIVSEEVLVSEGRENLSSCLRLSKEAEVFLLESFFRSSKGKEYRLGILPGSFFQDQCRNIAYIRNLARQCTFSGRGLFSPHVEVAALARKQIRNQEIAELNLSWLLCMHERIRTPGEPDENFSLLFLNSHDDGHCLATCRVNYRGVLSPEIGFLFVVE